MIVNVSLPQKMTSTCRQTGIALLQVLLITGLMSLLAIRFTQTARDQVEIADNFEKRVEAQLAAYSAVNEVIFLRWSDSSESLLSESAGSESQLPSRSRLNSYGDPISWREGVTVKLQDLNGLLPQIFPRHPLWSVLLRGLSVPESDATNYLGVWGDVQDSDGRNFSGGAEPQFLPNGHVYLNGFAQNSKILESVFFDKPSLVEKLLAFSDVYAPFESNVLNFPKPLLEVLLEPQIARQIIAQRHEGMYEMSLSALLPDWYTSESIFIHGSNRMRLEIDVDLGSAGWRETRIVSFYASRKPPFSIILNN